MTYLGNKSLERAALANRFRKGKTIAIGDRVVIRDQRQRRAGGRTVYKQPLTDPLVVESMHGNKCTLTRPDGTKVEDVHVEDMIVLQPDTRDLERTAMPKDDDDAPPVFPEDEVLLFDDHGTVDDVARKRSPGEMLEDDGKLREASIGSNKGNITF